MRFEEFCQLCRLSRPSRHQVIFARFDGAEETEEPLSMDVGPGPVSPLRNGLVIEDCSKFRFCIDRLDFKLRFREGLEHEQPRFIEQDDNHLVPYNGFAVQRRGNSAKDAR